MSARIFPYRSTRFRRGLLLAGLLILVALLWHFWELLSLTWPLVSLPLNWMRDSSSWIISQENDGFDVTFANYSIDQTSAGPGFEDKVPAILHHIMLGSRELVDGWDDARKGCIEMHPGWESIQWDDEKAQKLVAEKFPDFKPTWDGYELPIQRVDTLRYMILYEYGGAILDMDVQCKRALGPLRRFEFVAPAAYPTGFSVSFIMSSQKNEFIGSLLEKWLKLYDRHWFFLPYATVMFSTGGHFASAIHVMSPIRERLKILAGPKDDYKMHSLNGNASTPLFNHLGSSSWHSYDSMLIICLGKYLKWIGFGFLIGVIGTLIYRRRLAKKLEDDVILGIYTDK